MTRSSVLFDKKPLKKRFYERKEILQHSIHDNSIHEHFLHHRHQNIIG